MGLSHWNSSDWVQLIALVGCLCLSAFASASETALTSMNRVRARHMMERGLHGSEIVADLLHEPNQFLSAILILNTVVIIVASTLGANLAVQIFGELWGSVVASVGISVLVLAFCELIPKTIALYTNERTALRVARPVRLLTRVLNPLIFIFHALTTLVLRLRGIRSASGPFLTEAELITMVTVGEEQGVIEEDEKEMIQNVFTFEETPTHKVMVPRTEITAVDTEMSLTEAIEAALKEGHSRLPLYEEDIDHVVGIIYLKDLLRELHQQHMDISLRDIARPPLWVPATKRIGELFREFQTRKIHMAIVVDEYGGTDGLVTIEDLLEEIVGEIRDEHDVGEAEEIQQISNDEYLFDGLVSIDEVNEEMDLHIEAEGFDTLGGFLIDQLGRMPVLGDCVTVERVTMTIEAMDDLRIDRVRAVRLPDEPIVVEDNNDSHKT